MNKVPDFVVNPDPDIYRRGSYVVLDFETTNISFGSALIPKNRMVLACWTVVVGGEEVRKYAWGGEYDMQELVNDINSVDFLVAQNAKFELQWLQRCGYDIGSRPVYDTMVAEWVLAGGRRWRYNLNAIAARYGLGTKDDIVSKMMKGGVSSEDIPRSMLLRYCLQDVALTHEIMKKQLEAIEGTRFLPVVYTRCLTTVVLADIEGNGIHLDATRVEDQYGETLARFIRIERELDEMTGGINPRSSIQVADYLYDTLQFAELKDQKGEPRRTASDRRLTSQDDIKLLVATTDEQKRFLELKSEQGKLNAALSKNLDFFVAVCREKGGTFLGQMNQCRTVTHRLSSSGMPVKFEAYDKPKSCQFQNLPRQFKSLFCSRKEGWLMAEADGAQLEFRVAGHLGRDAQIQHDVVNHVDIHAYTAARLTEAGEPTTRQNAKASTFRPLYGGTSGSPAVQKYCKAFTRKYSDLHATQKGWVMQVVDQGYLDTEWGMRYYFPGVRTTSNGYVAGQQSVFNYPVQALATAEIIPIALVFFWYRTRDAELFIVNSVHDSIICEVPENEIELFGVSVVKALTTDVYEYMSKIYGVEFTVPLGVGMKLGNHWGEANQEAAVSLHGFMGDAGDNLENDGGEVTLDVYPPQ